MIYPHRRLPWFLVHFFPPGRLSCDNWHHIAAHHARIHLCGAV